jgi:hypothetical protein
MIKKTRIFNGVNIIENICLESFSKLNTNILNELPYDEDVIYNSEYHKDNLISELEFDIDKINYKGKLPLHIKEGKCNFCYPNNKTYTFHNPESDEFILRVVVDKLDDNNYIVMVCENKSKPKLKSPSINNDFPF